MAAFFGGALMAVGILIATLSGLCSGAVIIGDLIKALRDGSSAPFGGGGVLLVFGGLPFLVGLALFVIGRSIYRLAGGADRRPPSGGPTPPT